MLANSLISFKIYPISLFSDLFPSICPIQITRPFRYDLNQIPYDYTVEVRNRFKDLDLIDRVPDMELWNEVHDTVQETGIKTIPMEKEMQKSKMAV